MGKKNKGLQAFENYYSQIFGERWEVLKTALTSEKKHQSFRYDSSCPEYFLDQASIVAADSLGIVAGDSVLDLCAAPGGKSLILSQYLGENGSLVSNDRSANRRNRLIRVLDQHLPEEVRSKVTVTGHDACTWCQHQTEEFDRILLDAPCSSERHLLERPQRLDDWALGRSKRLAVTQWSILSSAFLVLKSGGHLVYSTCSLSPLENDAVIEKLYKKYEGRFEICSEQIEGGESTEYGKLFLPDNGGHGPLFISKIKKLS